MKEYQSKRKKRGSILSDPILFFFCCGKENGGFGERDEKRVCEMGFLIADHDGNVFGIDDDVDLLIRW